MSDASWTGFAGTMGQGLQQVAVQKQQQKHQKEQQQLQVEIAQLTALTKSEDPNVSALALKSLGGIAQDKYKPGQAMKEFETSFKSYLESAPTSAKPSAMPTMPGITGGPTTQGAITGGPPEGPPNAKGPQEAAPVFAPATTTPVGGPAGAPGAGTSGPGPAAQPMPGPAQPPGPIGAPSGAPDLTAAVPPPQQTPLNEYGMRTPGQELEQKAAAEYFNNIAKFKMEFETRVAVAREEEGIRSRQQLSPREKEQIAAEQKRTETYAGQRLESSQIAAQSKLDAAASKGTEPDRVAARSEAAYKRDAADKYQTDLKEIEDRQTLPVGNTRRLKPGSPEVQNLKIQAEQRYYRKIGVPPGTKGEFEKQDAPGAAPPAGGPPSAPPPPQQLKAAKDLAAKAKAGRATPQELDYLKSFLSTYGEWLKANKV